MNDQNIFRYTTACLATIGLLLAGCGQQGSNSPRDVVESATNVTTYQVKGVLKEIRAGGKKALVKHEDIPGYMEAMTMPFNVKNPAELTPLRPGDSITFRLSVTDNDDWIDNIKCIGTNVTPQSPVSVLTNSFAELEPGALLPDVVLTNDAGRSFRLSDFKGQALAFTFFFTRCPLPTYCPRMNNNFGAVQSTLQTGARTNWHLLSISFDPQFDTPAQLAAHSALYHADAAHWNFATGDAGVIARLGGSFGLMFWHEGASISHNLRTVVVDADGRVRKIYTDNEWKPEQLADEIQQAMKSTP